MENPVGMLVMQDYMQKFMEEFQYEMVQQTVDYCAWGHYYQKPTHVWTSMVFWGADWDAARGHRQVQAAVPPWEEGGKWEVEARMGHRSGETQGVWGAGQADE